MTSQNQTTPLSFKKWIQASHPRLTKRLRKKLFRSENWRALYVHYGIRRYGFTGGLHCYFDEMAWKIKREDPLWKMIPKEEGWSGGEIYFVP